MNAQVGNSTKEKHVKHSDLLICCHNLAERLGQQQLVIKIGELANSTELEDDKRVVEAILEAAGSEGFQTIIQRQSTDEVDALIPFLPMVVETRNRQYFVLTGIEKSIASEQSSITITNPKLNGNSSEERITVQQFQQLWSGGILRFEKINTSLACFSIIAREHKLDLTKDRLRHEYGLGAEEIPRDTLIRMK